MAANPQEEPRKRQNLTIQLTPEALQDARILAARRGLSVSRLVALALEKMISDEPAYEAARKRALALMKRGFHSGGGPYPKREELYDRPGPR